MESVSQSAVDQIDLAAARRQHRERLLTREEEYVLGAAMWEGHSVVCANMRPDVSLPGFLPFPTDLDMLVDVDSLLEPEQAILTSAYQARDRLIEANMRLVVSIARKYVGQGLPIKDLIQNGALGLIENVSRFDHTRGFKFSTFISPNIRQRISREIANTSRNIRLPVHAHESHREIYKCRQELSSQLERNPTSEEIAQYTGMTVAKVDHLLDIARNNLSLDAPKGAGDDRDYGDTLPSPGEPPEEAVLRRDLASGLARALDELSDRERRILIMRYDLYGDGSHAQTLEEVGKQFGVTRERIRQIEAKAFDKLRSPGNRAGRLALSAFVDNDE